MSDISEEVHRERAQKSAKWHPEAKYVVTGENLSYGLRAHTDNDKI